VNWLKKEDVVAVKGVWGALGELGEGGGILSQKVGL
jgi:hypothetical protein